MAHIMQRTIIGCTKSNIELCRVLQNFQANAPSNVVFEVLKEKSIRNKLATGLDIYTSFDKKAEASKKKLDELKWGEKISIGDITKEFMYKLAESMDLDYEKLFEVLDLYFSASNNKLKLTNLDKMENAIKESAKNYPVKVEDYKNQVSIFLEDMKPSIVKFYNDQRINLLKSILLVLVINISVADMGVTSVQDTTKEILKSVPKLIMAMQKACNNPISKELSNKEKQDILLQKCKEEQILLQIMYSLLSEYHSDIENVGKVKLDLIKYFRAYSFEGVYYALGNISININFTKIVETMRDTSVFIAMLCLSVNIHKLEATDNLAMIVQEVLNVERGTIDQLLKLTGYVIGLTAAKHQRQPVSSINEFKNLNFDAAISNVNIIH